MARDVIRRHLDLSDPANRHFLCEPDAREQHQTQWHQWGIISHTRVFLHLFDTEIPGLLREWGLWEPVHDHLRREIDGAARWQLLRIAILLHDIGKFAARTRGPRRFHFTHHEVLSGQIIRSGLQLQRFHLTPAQIEYIAETAEDHFVLGLVRKRAREEEGYDEEFVASPEFAQLCRAIVREHPDDFIEVGVLFLGDSLSKVRPNEGPEPARSQYEINLQVAHRYLAVVLDE